MIEKRQPFNGIPLRRDQYQESLGGRIPVRQAGRPANAASRATNGEGLFMVVWRGRWIMLTSVLIAIIAGIIYIRTATPIYTSTAKLYMEYGGIPIETNFDPGSVPKTDKYLNTQKDIISSELILGPAVDLLAPLRLRTLSEVDPNAYLRQNTSVSVGAKNDIISISSRSPYRDEVTVIVNNIVDAYMNWRSQHGQRNFMQWLTFQRDNMNQARQEVEQKQQSMVKFLQNSSLLWSSGSGQGEAILQRYLDLQAKYTQAQIRKNQAEILREAVRAFAGDPMALRLYVRSEGNAGLSTDTNAERVPLESRMVDLSIQKENVSDVFTADHPQVAGLSSELAWIESRLAGLDDQFVTVVRTVVERQCADANEHEQRLAALCDEEAGKVAALNAEAEQYRMLQSELEELHMRYQGFYKKLIDANNITGEEVEQLKMKPMGPASTPQAPSEPQKDKVLALSLVLGLLLGGGIALARDQFDQTVHSAEEISDLLGLPVLGTVPAMSRRRQIQERGRTILLRPDSHEAESFRTIRTAIFFGAPREHARTILVTSPAPGDGKSTLVSNLAIAMARAGQKILVLDADFRRPMQHAIFGLDHRERCLRNVLAGKMKLSTAIQPTGAKGPHLLTFGDGVSNPAEVLNSPQFALLLQRLVRVYDRVLIDAPPVTVVTDAQIIGALCDVTVVVLKAEKSTRRSGLRTVEALQSVGARILGVVVNEMRRSDERYGHHYDRYYGRNGTDSRNGGRDSARIRAIPSVAPGREI